MQSTRISILRVAMLALWFAITLTFWASVAVAIWLGEGMAEPADSAWPTILPCVIVAFALFAGRRAPV